MPAAELKFRGVPLGDFLVTIGGGMNRGGSPVITDVLGAELAKKLGLDSPNKRFILTFRIAIERDDQFQLEAEIWKISDLAAQPAGDVEAFDELGVLRRTYPDASLVTINYSAKPSATSNRVNSEVTLTFISTTRPVDP